MHGSADIARPEDGIEPPLAHRAWEAARLMGLKERKVRELIASGELESVKVGAARLVTTEAIKRYFAKLAKEQAA